jgi:hypothetical protein
MSALTLYRTAFWRLSILAVARNPELSGGQMLDELDITREARVLEVTHPGFHICCQHQELMARLEAEAAGAAV